MQTAKNMTGFASASICCSCLLASSFMVWWLMQRCIDKPRCVWYVHCIAELFCSCWGQCFVRMDSTTETTWSAILLLHMFSLSPSRKRCKHYYLNSSGNQSWNRSSGNVFDHIDIWSEPLAARTYLWNTFNASYEWTNRSCKDDIMWMQAAWQDKPPSSVILDEARRKEITKWGHPSMQQVVETHMNRVT